MSRPRLRLTAGPSALGVTGLSWAEAMNLARFLAAVTGRRYRVGPHPIPWLGWVVDAAGERPRAGQGTGQVRHLGVVR